MNRDKVQTHRECLVVISTTTRAARHTSVPPGSVWSHHGEEWTRRRCAVWCVSSSAKISEQTTHNTEKLQINRDVLIMARCVPGCEQEQDLLWDPDIVTGVENQYSAGISLSRHQPFSRVQGWTGPCDHFNISAPRMRGYSVSLYCLNNNTLAIIPH